MPKLSNEISNTPTPALQFSQTHQHWAGELFLALKKRGGGGGGGGGGGEWTPSEAEYHINILELLAAFFALKCFCSHMNNCHIQIQIDNTTALAYINNMGGSKSKERNQLAVQIWEWCISRNIWLTTVIIQLTRFGLRFSGLSKGGFRRRFRRGRSRAAGWCCKLGSAGWKLALTYPALGAGGRGWLRIFHGRFN